MERSALVFKNAATLIVLALWPAVLHAQQSLPQRFTYEGRLFDSSGNPLNSSVTFKFQIRSSNGICVLYEETQTADLSGPLETAGLFALQVGSEVGSSKRSAGDYGLPMKTIFSNQGIQIRGSDAFCVGGYTPTSGEDRVLRVIVDAMGVVETLSPDTRISVAPYATAAETLNGLDENAFVKVNSVPACVGSEALFFDGTAWNCIGVGMGTITGVAAGAGLVGGGSSGSVSLAVDVGTTGNKIVQLSGGALPAVSGENLTGLTGSQFANNSIPDSKIAGVSGSKVSGDIAGNAVGFSGALSGDVSGNQSATSVEKIKGRAVYDPGAMTDGYVLTWSSGNSRWEPKASAAGADDLGNHTATTNINLGSHWLSGGGAADGLRVDPAGNVEVSKSLLVNEQLKIAGGNPGAGKVLTSDADGLASWQTAGGGAVNSASNQGVSGVGVYEALNGGDLQFRNIASGSSKIAVSLNAGNKEIEIDVNEGNLTLENLGGSLGLAKGGTGATTPAGARTNLGLGTAAVADIGMTAGQVLAVDDVLICPQGEILQMQGPAPIFSWVCEKISYSDLHNKPGSYLTYKPNDVSCSAGEVLKWTNGPPEGWICALDMDTTTAAPAGSSGEIQFNSAGVMGASPNLKWTSNKLQVQGGTSGALDVSVNQLNDFEAVAQFRNMDPDISQGNGVWISAGASATDLPFYVSRRTSQDLFSVNGDGLTRISIYNSGVQPAIQLRSEAPPNDNQGPAIDFFARRTGESATNVSKVSGILTDKSVGAYKGALVFSTANSTPVPAERVRIDHLGNVGIGTTSPQAHLDIAGTGAMIVPRGNNSEKPSGPVSGMIRYNTDFQKFEAYEDGAWKNMIGGGGITGVGVESPLTSTGGSSPTLSLDDSGVTPGNYGSADSVPFLNIDPKGRVTSASSLTIAISASQITQSGANLNDTLKWNGSAWMADSATNLLGFEPLNRAGDDMSGALDMGLNKILNVPVPTAATDASNKDYVDTIVNNYILKAGDEMTGDLDLGSHRVINVAAPTAPADAATKNYSDTHIVGKPSYGLPAAGDMMVYDGSQWTYTPNPYPHPSRMVIFNDFVGGWQGLVGANELYEYVPFVFSTTGTSSKMAFQTPQSATDKNHPGQLRMESGTSSTGFAAVVGCSVDETYGTPYLSKQFLLGGGPIEYEVMVRYNLSSTGVTYRVGLTDQPDNAAPTKGIWVDQVGGTSQQWRYQSKGATATGAMPFGPATSFNTWVKIRISVNANATEVAFQINEDPPVVINDSNVIPTSDALCPTVMVMNSATGNKTLDLDYISLTQTFSTAR